MAYQNMTLQVRRVVVQDISSPYAGLVRCRNDGIFVVVVEVAPR